MGLSFAACRRPQAKRFLVDAAVLPQTLAVLQTRAVPIGVELEVVEQADLVVEQTVLQTLAVAEEMAIDLAEMVDLE